MDEQTTGGEQINVVEGNWYDDFAGDDQTRVEQLSKFDSFDAFLEDYNGTKNRDWRAEIAGDDEKFLSKLQRFDSPAAFGSTYREAEQKIRSGDIGPAKPGPDASEDEIKEYRRELGLPLEAEGYLKDLPEGLVIGEDDKEIVGKFLETMHEANAPKEYVHQTLQFYNELEEQMQETLVEADTYHKQEAEDALREVWGGDFRANLNVINSLFDAHMSKEAKEELLNGRYADGRGFMNNPEILQFFAEIGRKINPLSTILPRGEDDIKGLEAEIAEIEKFMQTNRADYNKDQKMQDRLLQLYQMRLDYQRNENAA
jgi:hypothetical protein